MRFLSRYMQQSVHTGSRETSLADLGKDTEARSHTSDKDHSKMHTAPRNGEGCTKLHPSYHGIKNTTQ